MLSFKVAFVFKVIFVFKEGFVFKEVFVFNISSLLFSSFFFLKISIKMKLPARFFAEIITFLTQQRRGWGSIILVDRF